MPTRWKKSSAVTKSLTSSSGNGHIAPKRMLGNKCTKNPKSESRNPKQIRNPKFQSKHLDHLSCSCLEFVSDFEIRISDLGSRCFILWRGGFRKRSDQV